MAEQVAVLPSGRGRQDLACEGTVVNSHTILAVEQLDDLRVGESRFTEEGGVAGARDERLAKIQNRIGFLTLVAGADDLRGGELTRQAEFAAQRVARQDERAGADVLVRIA